MHVNTPDPSADSQAGSAPSLPPSVNDGEVQVTSAASGRPRYNLVVEKRMPDDDDCWFGDVNFIIQGGKIAPTKNAPMTYNSGQYPGTQQESGNTVLQHGVCYTADGKGRQFTATLSEVDPDPSIAPREVNADPYKYQLRFETVVDPEEIVSRSDYDPNANIFESDGNGFRWRNNQVEVRTYFGCPILNTRTETNIGETADDNSYTARLENI